MATGEATVVLEVRDVSKTYGSVVHKRRVKALDRASFRLNEGEICGLVGPNGAGKSTLIKIVMGIEGRDGGTIALRGGMDALGYVPERPTFLEDLSAYYNLLYFARMYGLKDPETESMNALKEFGLADREEDCVGEFSKGMKQRLAIARALLHSPKVLLMDEPFSGLDPSAMIDLRSVLKGLKSSNISILLSSHELNEIDQVCDSILFIKSGRIVGKEGYSTGSKVNLQLVIMNPGEMVARALGPRKIVSASEDGRTLVVEADQDEASDIVAALVQAGVKVAEAKVLQRRAEDMYAEMIMKEARA